MESNSTLPMKSSDTGSPPPNSATTSGSTLTPNSITDHNSESPSGPLQPSRHSSQGDEGWSVSVSGGMITGYSSAASSEVPAGSEQCSPSQSPGGRYNPGAYPSAIKLLVSNNVAGSIIGRAGQTIMDLQTQSSARIKLSQTGDFYPGTQDRVCLVQGQLENVKTAVTLLVDRLYKLQEQQHSQHLSRQPNQNDSASLGFDFVVRLLVPTSSCGMIIGKAGSNIKHMEETSGVSSVRLSPKESSDPSSPSAAVVSGTSERVVTLTGPTMESCLKCIHIVLDGMMAHHEICRYSNMTTSYSRVVMPGSFNPLPQAARQVLVVPTSANQEPGMWDTQGQYNPFVGRRSNSSPELTGPMIWDQRGIPPRIAAEPPAAPIARHVPREPIQQYNQGFTDMPPSFSHEMPPLMHTSARGPNSNPQQLYVLPNPTPNQIDQAAMSNSTSAPDLLALQMQEKLLLSSSPTSNPVDYTNFVPQHPQSAPAAFTAQVVVPDTMIGSILGRGGRTLNELQMQSNTRIRISQRGEYVPGTRNRIVTIRGSSAHNVSLAQYLMSQHMVLPPTATYSSQTPYHPPQHQQRQVQHLPQQRQDIHSTQYQGAHESAFQSLDTAVNNSSASMTPTGNTPNKDISHP